MIPLESEDLMEGWVWMLKVDFHRETLQESFDINVLGVHRVTRAFLPLLQQGKLKKVANISTTFGSLTMIPYLPFSPCPAYKISKAAMNALTVQYALDHGKEGFSFMALCPDWMKTELGGGDMAALTPEQGAKRKSSR
ncbi:hypothetical protein CGRA01v4_06945 [Colletotrichum graminicola]|nr:hypothetical protein CGRA01v4_06945 [Colletotrichum graminicola]